MLGIKPLHWKRWQKISKLNRLGSCNLIGYCSWNLLFYSNDGTGLTRFCQKRQILKINLENVEIWNLDILVLKKTTNLFLIKCSLFMFAIVHLLNVILLNIHANWIEKRKSTFALWELVFARKLHLAEDYFCELFNFAHLARIYFCSCGMLFLSFFFYCFCLFFLFIFSV